MADTIPSSAPARVPTGIAGLDLILNGGILSGGAYIVMGLPGAGKTTLGTQVSFRHVGGGGRVLYVTLLAESHARMMQHMASFGFFDPKPIGHELYLVSAFAVLESEGLTGVLALLKRETADKNITLLVLDGLVTAETIAPSEIDIKKFVHEVQALLALCRCTALFLTNPAGRTSYPAHTMVDGIFELRSSKFGLRSVRHLDILKFRGSEHLEGEHVFDISHEGITVHPRLECLPTPASRDGARGPRISTNIAHLDEMLGGGLTPESTTLLIGPNGSGKTLVGLSFLANGASRGEPSLFVGFAETEGQLRQAARAVSLDLDGPIEQGTLIVQTFQASEIDTDRIGESIIEQAKKRKIRRLFIDGLGLFKAGAAAQDRVPGFVAALTSQLRARGVTTILSESTIELFGSSISPPAARIAVRADNIIFLRYVELRSQLHRLISIVKERGSKCDSSIREFVISDDGIDVASTFQSAEAVLGDVAGNGGPHHSKAKAKPKGKKRRKGAGRRRP
jgi:circadian clock protein KaiC